MGRTVYGSGWGQALNDFLSVEFSYDGSLKSGKAIPPDATTDQSATITAGFSRSNAVSLQSGTYLLTGPIVIPSGGSLLMRDDTYLTRTGTGNAIEAIGTSGTHKTNIHIRGGNITGPSVVGTQVAGDGISIDYCDNCDVIGTNVSGFGANGDDAALQIRRSTYIRVERCDLSYSKNGLCTGTSTSVAFPEVEHSLFLGNRCHHNYDDGLHLQQSARNRAIANNCSNNGADVSSVGSGIDTLGCNGELIAGNTCNNNYGMGIEVGNTTSTGSADQLITITGNICESNGTRGIGFLAWSERCTVTGNCCQLNGEDGISIAGSATHPDVYIVVTGNVCDQNVRNGIYVVNTSNSNHVSDNICRANGARGIYVVSAGAGNPTSNEIIDNHASGNTTAQITLGSGATTTVIKGNTGYVDTNSGVTSVADGGTISHGLAAAPTRYGATSGITNQFVSITAVSASTLTVAVKTDTGAAGTTGNVAWWAAV